MKHKTTLVIGNFDVLHPGHIRLLKFAKECTGYLIVAVNSDKRMEVQSRVNEQHRLEVIKSLECVDEAFLTSKSPSDTILKTKPDIVVKGKEFETRDNPEQSVLDSYGGKLLFGSGEFEVSLEQYIGRSAIFESNHLTSVQGYLTRHKLTNDGMHQTLNSFRDLKVAVLGEVIVDEYIHGTAIGLSQEDPTIVMTPEKSELFLGGAAITAGHIKSLGAKKVELISVLGDDEKADYVIDNIANYQVISHLFRDPSRPTSLKTRYRASNKTLLRVNKVRQHKISKQLQLDVLKQVNDIIKNIDLLVFSDFNYGMLTQSLVDEITQICHMNKVMVVADSQTSSQVGDISRYKDMMLITPTEKEVRVALNNPDDGLVTLANKLCQKANPELLAITLAGDGVFLHIPNKATGSWVNDSLPAFNTHAIDPAGAGDCFLATCSLALCAKASPWEAFFLANLAAACQVANVGNTPLHLDTLKKEISTFVN